MGPAQVEIDDMVRAVQAFGEMSFGKLSHFHLSPCGVCRAPTFQYPCPSCRSWCDASDTPDQRQAQIEAARRSKVGTRETFVRRVEASGGIGPWYFGNFRNTVGYDKGGTFTAEVNASVERTREVSWPDAGLVWDTVTAEGISLPPDDFWRHKHADIGHRAVEEYGQERLSDMSRRPDRQGRTWPDCPEGRSLIVARAQDELAQLGLAEPTVAPSGP